MAKATLGGHQKWVLGCDLYIGFEESSVSGSEDETVNVCSDGREFNSSLVVDL